MKIQKCYFLLVFVLGFSNGWSQEIYHPVYDVTQNNPKEATVSKLFQYQKFPVNMSTGIANIDIPLYEIVDGNIRVPISINFSTGGIKVNQLPSCLGIGWSLNCGGMIYQKVNGLDDLGGNEGDQQSSGTYFDPEMYNNSPITNQVINTMPDFFNYYQNAIASPQDTTNVCLSWRFFGKIIDGVFDGEADEFKINVPGLTNTIFFDQASMECKMQKVDGSSIYQWPVMVSEGWIVNGANGNNYNFFIPLKYKNPLAYNPHAIPSGLPMNPTGGGQIKNTYLNDIWPLENITDTRTGKQVNFSYSINSTSIPNMNFGKTSYRLAYMNSTMVGLNNGLQYPGLEMHEREEAQLNEVTFSGGKVEFIYDNIQLNQFGPKLLKQIKILDSYNNVIKIFSFLYTQKPTISNGGTIDNNTTCNFLYKINSTYIENGVEKSTTLYEFDYYSEHTLPKRFIYAQDRWGYYNGQTQNTTFFPIEDILLYNGQNASSIGANRNIDFNYSKIGNLKSIKYPTKGIAEFHYEPNSASSLIRGGSRIKEIKYKPLNGTSPVVSKYDYIGGGGEVLPSFTSSYYMAQFNDGHTVVNVNGSSLTPQNINGSNGIFYSIVDEINNSTELGKTRHYFSLRGNLPHPGMGTGYPYAKTDNLYSYGALETLTETYKYNSQSSQFDKILSEEKVIEPIKNLSDYVENVHGYWSMIMLDPLAVYFPGNDPYSVNPYPTMNMWTMVNHFNLYSDALLPSNVEKKVFENGNVLTDNTELEYDTETGQTKLARSISSNGDIQETRVKFIRNFSTYNNSDSWNLMLQNSLRSLPIEISVYEKKVGESTFKLLKSTLYKYDNNNVKEVYVLETTGPVTNFTESNNTSTQFVYDSRYVKKFEVLQYDNNYNPILLEDNKVRVGYVYDGTNSNAIAVIKNAGASGGFAYSSFEDASKGNWTYTGTVLQETSPTGYKLYDLSTGNISKAGLNSSTSYVVSYWSNNGSKNVNGSTGNIKRSYNGYSNYEHVVSGATTVTVSGTGKIDELRLYPSGAQMTSYTYKPLIGISSQCDINGLISYYEYDAYNRLEIVRDMQRNVLKRYCYNYYGEQEECVACSSTSANWAYTGNSRCQVNSSTCAYTGYQEVEQEDTNECSETYGTKQWVMGSYNPTACANSGLVQLAVNNIAGASNLSVTITQTAPTWGNPQTFTIPAGGGPITCIQGGKTNKYSVTITANGIPMLVNYTLTGMTISGTPATFNNVSFVQPLMGGPVNLVIDHD